MFSLISLICLITIIYLVLFVTSGEKLKPRIMSKKGSRIKSLKGFGSKVHCEDHLSDSASSTETSHVPSLSKIMITF